MSAATANLAGLNDRKGHLLPGYDADIVIWHPEREFMVETGMIEFKNKVTPYAGMELYGVVESTIVRGEIVYSSWDFGEIPKGRLITN
jgi:allantoinase